MSTTRARVDARRRAGEVERGQREGAVAPERDLRHRQRVGERVLRRAADELDDRRRRRHGEAAEPAVSVMALSPRSGFASSVV